VHPAVTPLYMLPDVTAVPLSIHCPVVTYDRFGGRAKERWDLLRKVKKEEKRRRKGQF